MKNQNQKGKIMFKATCSECGKPCEVPFLPIDGKPVYCPECFAKKYPPKAPAPRPAFNKSAPKQSLNNRPLQGGNDRQLSEINAKLDRLISAIEKMNFSASVAKASKPEKAEKKAAPKKVAKKAPAKKKK